MYIIISSVIKINLFKAINTIKQQVVDNNLYFLSKTRKDRLGLKTGLKGTE